MQFFLFTAVAASLAASTLAAASEKRQIDSVTIFFYTPGGEKIQQIFPTDMSSEDVETDKVIAKIYNPGGATCGFTGVKGERVDVPIGEHKLETPQALKWGLCAHN